MPTKMTTAYRQHDRGERVIGDSYRKGVRDKNRAAKLNAAIDNDFLRARLTWVFLPPANMNLLFLYQNTEIIVSVPHELGRVLLLKRRGHIVERNVVPDVVIEYSDLSEAWSVFGLGADAEPTQEPSSLTIELLTDVESMPVGTVIQIPGTMGRDLIKYGIAVESNDQATVVVTDDGDLG